MSLLAQIYAATALLFAASRADLAYVQSLKSMARADGVDVPLYTMTGWEVPIPDSGLIPMFGRYGDAFWMDEGDPETIKSYFINGARDDRDEGLRNSLEIRVMPLYKKDVGRIPSAARLKLQDKPAIAEVLEIKSLDKRQVSVKF